MNRINRRDLLSSAVASLPLASCGRRPESSEDCIEILTDLLREATSEQASRVLLIKRRLYYTPFTKSATILVRRSRKLIMALAFGPKTAIDTPFLLASISKPITATGVMVLADRQELRISDRVTKFLPEFAGARHDEITVQQLLSHTSGLPDGFPDLDFLSKGRRPVGDFFSESCRMPLLFKPGSSYSYSNLGVLIASKIAEKVTGVPFRKFLADEVFRPLKMTSTSLGLGGRSVEETVQTQDAPFANLHYWRDLGAPWNGVHSTIKDLAKFLDVFLYPGETLFRHETALAMLTDYTRGLCGITRQGRLGALASHFGMRIRQPQPAPPIGLGWFLNREGFGRSCSNRTFGHHGLSGTLVWADPQTQISLVLLTSKSIVTSRDGLLGPVSDLVSESV